jgi:hypothetical protein
MVCEERRCVRMRVLYLVCFELCARSDPLSLPARSIKLSLPIVWERRGRDGESEIEREMKKGED